MEPILVSKPNKALVVPRTEAVENAFAGAPLLDDKHVLLPHGMHEYLLLRHWGYKLPHPMFLYYDFRGSKPFSVQKSTCNLLTTHGRCYVLNALGTGKTASALWAWDYLYSNGYAGKLLVVAPLSTLNFTWAAECFRRIPHRKCVVLHGSKNKRQELLRQTNADIYIINHDGIKTLRADLIARTDITCLVLDELAVYRNNNPRSRDMRAFASRFDWVWGMTGQPMPNEPTDVWAQCKIVTPSTVPKYKSHAEEMLMKQVSQYVMVPKPGATKIALGWMQPSVRFTLDDVVELPEVVHQTIDVPLSPEQTKAYKTVSTAFKAMIQGKEITAINAASAMNKLLQISSGWVYYDNPKYVDLKPADRITQLLEIIDAAPHKVLVFAPYRCTVEELHKQIIRHGIGDCFLIHGETSAYDRDQMFTLFQETDKGKVICAHPKCLAHGITLTAASTIVWWGPTPSLETYDQANARIRRVGQTNRQQVFHLQSTPVERKIYNLLRSKQNVQNQFLRLLEEATGEPLT